MKKKAKIRLFLEASLQLGNQVLLNDKQSHYLLNVMKLVAGDELLAFDNANGEFVCQIENVSKKACSLFVEKQTRIFSPCPDIWLLFAPVKKDQTDFIIQKATELGASKIIPIITARTIAEKIKKERFEAQSIEAAEQCRRVDIPEISEALSLNKALESWDNNRTLYFMDETGLGENVNTAFAPDKTKAAILVGPEGGFAEEELDKLRKLPFAKGAVMGKRILRAETAVAAALTAWQMLAGDWREE